MITMKTKLHKLASLLLAFALTLCLALPAGAVEEGQGDVVTYSIPEAPNNGGTISLTNMENGATATAYKIIDVAYDYAEGTTDAYEAPLYPEFFWVTSVAEWVRTNYSSYIGTGTDNSVQKTYASATATADNLKSFADAIAAAIRGNQISGVTGITPSTQNTFSGLNMGAYLILVEGGTKIYNPILINLEAEWKDNNWTLTTPTQDVTVKASELTLTKSVSEDQVAIGDTVTYTVVADVPAYPAKATATGYHISDKLPDGMTLGTVEVYGETSESQATKLTANEHYTIVTSSATRPVTNRPSVSFDIEFKYEKIKSFSKIKVTYTATANKDLDVIAAKGNTGNVNTAYLDYNNNPYETTADKTWKTKEATATVYTYGIKVKKVDEANNPLSGATFALSKSENGDSFISFVGSNGTYRVAETAEADTDTEDLVVNSSEDANKGLLTLSGLDVGTYYLFETAAPNGYNKLSAPIVITIKDDKDNDGEDGNTNHDGVVDDGGATTGYTNAVTVPNTKGFTLPTTGGMGTVLFTAGGVLLMGAGLVVLVLFLRRRTSR